MERITTLTEISTTWSIDDIADANAVIDYRDAVRAEANRKAELDRRNASSRRGTR